MAPSFITGWYCFRFFDDTNDFFFHFERCNRTFYWILKCRQRVILPTDKCYLLLWSVSSPTDTRTRVKLGARRHWSISQMNAAMLKDALCRHFEASSNQILDWGKDELNIRLIGNKQRVVFTLVYVHGHQDGRWGDRRLGTWQPRAVAI